VLAGACNRPELRAPGAAADHLCHWGLHREEAVKGKYRRKYARNADADCDPEVVQSCAALRG
jgi:hypothetical protein